MIVTSCHLTHHSETSSKGSRETNNTAPLPYNGILAPRETHSEVLTIPRRSVLWQLLPRQRICPVRSFMEDFGWFSDELEYRSSFLLWQIASHESEYLDYCACLGMFSDGLYLHSRLYQHSLYHDCQIERQPFSNMKKKATLIQFHIRRPAETCNYTPFYWLAGMLCWSEEI